MILIKKIQLNMHYKQYASQYLEVPPLNLIHFLDFLFQETKITKIPVKNGL